MILSIRIMPNGEKIFKFKTIIMNGTLINELDFKSLKDLCKKREILKQDEKETKAYHFSNDAEMGFKHFNAKAQRKQVEKQIFKLIKTL